MAYCAFMSECLIALEKNSGICLVGVREIWISLLDKCVLRVTGPEATSACQYCQICNGLKAGIYSTIHRIKAIWDTKLTMEDWGFLLVDAKDAFNKIN